MRKLWIFAPILLAAALLAYAGGQIFGGVTFKNGAVDLAEMTDPGVPATNTVTIWAEDVNSLAVANESGTVYLQVTADGTVDLGTTPGAQDGTLAVANLGAGNILTLAASSNWNGNAFYGDTFLTQNKTADFTVNASGIVWTNIGDADVITFTLPAGASGYKVTFVRHAAFELRVDPNASDKILDASLAPVDGEYVTTNTGSEFATLTLTCLSTADWVVTSRTGTWTEETP